MSSGKGGTLVGMPGCRKKYTKLQNLGKNAHSAQVTAVLVEKAARHSHSLSQESSQPAFSDFKKEDPPEFLGGRSCGLFLRLTQNLNAQILKDLSFVEEE